MTERLRHAQPYGHGAFNTNSDPSRATPPQQSSGDGLSSRKTMIVLVVVVGCFAVLWPKIFYPMLVNNANSHIKPGPVDRTAGCCDVISEMDVDTIKIMAELCSTIIESKGGTTPSPKQIVVQCRKAVLETCGIDISAALQDRISLGHSAKQILEEVRSLNGSLCLKYNFGVSPWKLGVPHRVNINLDPANSIKQERSSQMRQGMVHPAFKERGRAIPETDISGIPRRTSPQPRIVEGRPGPIPGMRPAMGGAGYVVPPSKQSSYGYTGVLMPLYTIGFLIFFAYTIAKMIMRKKQEPYVGAPLYPPCDSDEHFKKEVFEPNRHYFNRPKDNSKIVVNAVAALLEEVDKELDQKAKSPVAQISTTEQQDEIKPNGSVPKEEEQGSVTVMGMETTASSESGKRWSRPDSPVLPHPQPAPPKEPSPPPQQIFLEGALPPLSQILVADSATEAQKDSAEDDSPVVLAGKMTLSVISLDSETGTENSSDSNKKVETSDEERRTSSSNVSEEFEKIDAADLEEQIDNIIEEAENIALAEETGYSPSEDLEHLSETETDPPITDKEIKSDLLEEIKNEFNLEDDLLQALREKEPERRTELPVTDLIKEFLSKEENLLLEEAVVSKVQIPEDFHDESELQSSDEVNFTSEKADSLTETFKGNESQQKEQENIENEIEIDESREGDEKEIDYEILASKKVSDPIKEGSEEKRQNREEKEGNRETRDEKEINSEFSRVRFQTTDKEISPAGIKDISEIEALKPEETIVKNGADLLLQGLLVRDDEKIPESSDDIDDVNFEQTSAIAEALISDISQEAMERAAEEQERLSSHGLDYEEDELEDVEYEDESDQEDAEDELREIDEVGSYEDRESVERRLNGDDVDSSRNGATNSGIAAENEISEDELENEEDEEIEEIIEYVDNTDEEGEEIIEINGNEHINAEENGAN